MESSSTPTKPDIPGVVRKQRATRWIAAIGLVVTLAVTLAFIALMIFGGL